MQAENIVVDYKSFLEKTPPLCKAIQKVTAGLRSMQPVPEFPGTQPRILLVGGFVRDILTNTISKDVDIEVYGLDTERLEEKLTELFPGRMNVVGRAFGILKISIEEGVDLDISIPRRESKFGLGHKGFTVSGDPVMKIADAFKRRDFTINAMAVDAVSGELIDPFNGQDDLEKKILRIVSSATFQDDPLRVYRAVQLAARLNLTIEKNTKDLMRKMTKRGDLDELSKERITEEIKKLLLKAERPSVGFELMRELGIITRDYPELNALIGTEQEQEWHPEGDVWTHTLMVVDQAASMIRRPECALTELEKLQVMLGALCHDLGKPATTELLEGRIRSRGHEDAGIEPTESLLNRWTFGSDALQAAQAIAAEHLKPTMLYFSKLKGQMTDEQYTNAVRRLLKRIAPLSYDVFLTAAEADSRGRGLPDTDKEIHAPCDMMREVIKREGLDGSAMKPLLQGMDLIELGFSPGPKMGELIADIEAARDRGEIKTKEEALERVRKNP
ncbi:MAG: HD domain-containing protein [Patescibacteria group bacterium]|nr:HD domain-containing protein [Patescibacteria group bacterium]